MEPQEPKTEKPLSNRERAAIKDELITELVAGCQNEGDLFGPEGVFTRLTGPVQVRVPRDREGTFEPQLVKKRQTRLEGFDEKVLALYGRGMSTRDIQAHLHELYGTDVSHEL